MALDMVISLLDGAGDPVHLNREKAFTALEHAIDSQNLKESADAIQALQQGVLTMKNSDQWEQRLGALRIAVILISKQAADPSFLDNALQMCSDLLEDVEVRVRLAVGELLRALSVEMSTLVWSRTSHRIITSIKSNFVRCKCTCCCCCCCCYSQLAGPSSDLYF